MKKAIVILIGICLIIFTLAACTHEGGKAAATFSSEDSVYTSADTDNTSAVKSTELSGKTLFIYCGAGMKKPLADIADAFQKSTGAKVEVTYGNAAQIISQIKTSDQGDIFVAGDEGDLASIRDECIASVKSLAKHIPVIAVQKDNPKKITGLKDFNRKGVEVVLGDNSATPIGKIADKALKEAGVLSDINIVSRAATAPEIATALSLGQCDAVIVWKENTKVKGVEILESTEMDKYIKVIPAASLKCSTNTEAREAFLSYLDTDSVKEIWKNYGYEMPD